jgi:hypothetical protein
MTLGKKVVFILNEDLNITATLSIITSDILFGLGASLSLVNHASWLAHDSWERGSQATWRNYRKGVVINNYVISAALLMLHFSFVIVHHVEKSPRINSFPFFNGNRFNFVHKNRAYRLFLISFIVFYMRRISVGVRRFLVSGDTTMKAFGACSWMFAKSS